MRKNGNARTEIDNDEDEQVDDQIQEMLPAAMDGGDDDGWHDHASGGGDRSINTALVCIIEY